MTVLTNTTSLRRSFYWAFSLLIMTTWSCTIEQPEVENSNPEPIQEVQKVRIDEKIFLAEYKQVVAEHQARLAGLRKGDCRKVVRVPADYPTIQAAVDAVCDEGKIFVSRGLYHEEVVVYKPGLDIKANGEVQLMGKFYIIKGADNVSITKFDITPPSHSGIPLSGIAISAVEVKGGLIKHNTISSGSRSTGIGLYNSSEISVTHNNITGGGSGIIVIASPPISFKSEKFLIAHNTITGIASSGIDMQGDVDHSMIRNNIITRKTEESNAAITLFTILEYVYMGIEGSPDHNVIRNNILTNHIGNGIALIDGGEYNKIGPDNVVKYNTGFGLWLDLGSQYNHVFNNTLLHNDYGDVYDSGRNNTFENNVIGTKYEWSMN